MKKMPLVFTVLCALVLFTKAANANQVYDLIDVPTADALESYGYNVSFRFYTDGGILNTASFGVSQRINVGFSWDLDRVIGSSKIDVQEPAINVRFRIFDGEMFVPAIALGYNGQGYNYEEAEEEYRHREKGVYIVASNEIFFPGLEYHMGGYIYDFHEDLVLGFAGLSMVLGEAITLILEYDNIHEVKENRFNAGLRYFVTPTIFIDLAGRDMGAAGRDAERVVRINYLGSF